MAKATKRKYARSTSKDVKSEMHRSAALPEAVQEVKAAR